ncbi:DHS-like NAD/FAD-binding domain-containing protein [Auriculariales sp. MPI-PUGE-AT-0066]|nr:DHS-like NAD/FAD-binding domain-containing protein [Auriculariales sp. MPI-PUGE-AT-0066]
MDAFIKALRRSRNIIAVCGAGLSAASGIPTFRGAGGLWRRYQAMDLATPEAFEDNPSLVWQFYHYRRVSALRSEPNAAHFALGLLTQIDTLSRIAPNCHSFNIVTQNVDGLSPRAHALLPNPEAASLRTWEMHGKVHETVCLICGDSRFDTRLAICQSLEGTERHFQNDDTPENDILRGDLPCCEKDECGGLLRPGVVWFGEIPQHLPEIDRFVADADLCLVIGTSSTVYPAASYASEVRDHGGKVAVFNLERSTGDDESDFLFLGPCEKTVPEALGVEDDIVQLGVVVEGDA